MPQNNSEFNEYSTYQSDEGIIGLGEDISSNDLDLITPESVIDTDSVSEQNEQNSFEKDEDLKKKTLTNLFNKRYKQNTKLRNKLACWAQDLVSVYLVLVFFLICLNDYLIKLSDAVLITLLGTTTVNVLGLMYIAMKDLFNGKSEDKK